MEATCAISGKKFQVSDLEMELRRKFGIEGPPSVMPEYRFRELGAFWQHWNLHKRKCDKTGRDIISVFRPDCEYPIWHKDEWVAHADPPGADLDFSREVFPQMWEFFKKSPLPHTTGAGNENCEYTDDAWYSKNVYLTHSLARCEDLAYCYRTLDSSDCYYCVFSNKLELCYDVVNSDSCFNVVFGLNSRACRDSAFLYDCRDCSDCMFCFNQRNKQYCFGNQQLTKEAYMRKKAEWELGDRDVYEKAKVFFTQMMKTQAWHRALSNNKCENTNGNYNDNCKDSENCYFSQDNEQCANCFRNHVGKTSLDFHGQTSELCFYSILGQDKCYDIRFSSQIVQSRYMQYSAFCLNCQYCFGCCGLVGKKYHIFNKPYSGEEYNVLVPKLIEHMKSTGEYGRFFPGYFAQNPYDESWSNFYFPLDREGQEAAGFKWMPPVERREEVHLDSAETPRRVDDEVDFGSVYWDEVYDKPFKIRKEDQAFCRRLGAPLPSTYYIRRIQDNFRMVPFEGRLREAVCGKCGAGLQTSWPSEYDGRILCEKDYLEVVKG